MARSLLDWADVVRAMNIGPEDPASIFALDPSWSRERAVDAMLSLPSLPAVVWASREQIHAWSRNVWPMTPTLFGIPLREHPGC